MEIGVFEIKQNAIGWFYFIFTDESEQRMFVSSSFERRSELEKCLAEVRDISTYASIYDADDFLKRPLFVIYEIDEGFTFSLIGYQGEIILSSRVFTLKLECISAILYLKQLASKARILDLS